MTNAECILDLASMRRAFWGRLFSMLAKYYIKYTYRVGCLAG